MSKASRIVLALFVLLLSSRLVRAEQVVTRVHDGEKVPLARVVSDMAGADLVLIGEAHDDKAHHEMQLDLIRSLHDKKVPFAIALEMFDAASQKELDDWSAGRIPERDFLPVYARNWSLDWSLYRDIFLFARDNHIPMIGLNISKDLALKVSRQGCGALGKEEMGSLPAGTNCDLDNPHTRLLERSFKELFSRVSAGRGFVHFCQAQTVRNSAMAMNAARYMRENPGRKVVVLAGVWHAVKNAVPDQLRRAGMKLDSVVVLPEIPELAAGNVSPDVADYLVKP